MKNRTQYHITGAIKPPATPPLLVISHEIPQTKQPNYTAENVYKVLDVER